MFSIDGSHCASTHGLVISVMILQILHCLSHQGSPYRTLMSINSFLLLFFKNLFIAYFWQCWVVIGLQHMVFLYLWRAGVTLCCGSWACSGSAVVAHRLSYSRACGISLDLGSNQVPCIGRWILCHWATRMKLDPSSQMKTQRQSRQCFRISNQNELEVKFTLIWTSLVPQW